MKDKKQITEGMNIHKEWYTQAQNQTMETLPTFINHLMDNYHHDYGTICHAISAGSIATANAMNNSSDGGITGFQASCVMWEFIMNWTYKNNKVGLKMIDYDNFLYPQYEHKYQKVISKDIWEKIQKEAAENIKLNETVHINVRKHWEDIVKGIVPFGYKVVEDDE